MRNYASLQTQLLSDLGFKDGITDFHIMSDMDNRTAASVALASSFYKKLCPEGTSKLADDNALIKFKNINNALPEEPTEFVANNEAESCFYDYYKDNLRQALEPHGSFGTFDLDFIRENMMVGPGAAQKADSAWMVSKLFESPMSFTDKSLITLYRSALSETGLWAEAEMLRFHKHGFVKVTGGKLFFAPKNAEISRTCCTEANLNMLIQKAIGAFIEVRLGKFYGISLGKQPDLNREMARIGSIDGSLGTIDLVSASDSIGLQLIKRDLPEGALKRSILNSRSQYAILPDGSQVELRMVSTMGNGFTFPLQTLLFACAVRACYHVMGFPCHDPGTEFGVFGDDIIVRRETYDFVIKMLTKLGFTVNGGKSFNTGSFRESCGHDYNRGVNIRGVYIRTLETPQQVYSALNRLTRWSALHSIDISGTIRLLLSWVRDIRTPLEESDDAGIQVPFSATRPSLDDNYWFKYRSYVRRAKKRLVAEPDAIVDAPDNPLGLSVGFLSGYIRRRDILLTNPSDSAWKHDLSLSVSVRELRGARARYQIVTKCTPFWDYLPSKLQSNLGIVYDEWRCPLTRVTHERWKTLMVAILT